MAIGAVLVDRARVVQRVGTGVKVEGSTLMADTREQWFRARLFLDMAQSPERTEQGERRKVVALPQLMFATKDLDGQPIEVVAEVVVEVASPQLGTARWRVTGDPQPIRKKRTVIGGLVTLERVVERERVSV